MLLTITTTYRPATDLGYLLHKHPDRVQTFAESVGQAHVFYPEATEDRATAALLLEVDPVGLVRGRGAGFALGQYVNDRPYAASSMLAMAMKDVFRTALTGRCDARPELARTALPLQLRVPAVPCRGGTVLLQRLFEPLGWSVDARPVPLDPAFPAWGDSDYVDLRLHGVVRLADALNHLYVLLPVLDDAKHYWVSDDEVDKLVRAGAGWLEAHPERELVARRYLAHQRSFTVAALARLAEVDDVPVEQVDDAVADGTATVDDGVAAATAHPAGTAAAQDVVPLARARHDAVLAEVLAAPAHRTVGDLGCGEGRLTATLLARPEIDRVVAVDVSSRALDLAARLLHLDRMPDAQRARLELFQTSLLYRDERLGGLDVAVLVEVVEHVDPTRLAALERAVFAHAAPTTVVVTTPNAEHNARFAHLTAAGHRHHDHRFEWTRGQFAAWAEHVAATYDYRVVRYVPIGTDDPDVGPPTQLVVLNRHGDVS